MKTTRILAVAAVSLAVSGLLAACSNSTSTSEPSASAGSSASASTDATAGSSASASASSGVDEEGFSEVTADAFGKAFGQQFNAFFDGAGKQAVYAVTQAKNDGKVVGETALLNNPDGSLVYTVAGAGQDGTSHVAVLECLKSGTCYTQQDKGKWTKSKETAANLAAPIPSQLAQIMSAFDPETGVFLTGKGNKFRAQGTIGTGDSAQVISATFDFTGTEIHAVTETDNGASSTTVVKYGPVMAVKAPSANELAASK